MKPTRNPTPATLQDVSAEAGVSVATVSRVLSGRGGVSGAKAAEVKRAVQEVGYSPQRQRRSRPRAASEPVALVRFSDDALLRYSNDFSQSLRGVAGALAAENIPMLYADLSGGQPLPEAVARGRVQGLLLAGSDQAGRLEKLPGLPAFWLTSHREEGTGASALAGNEHVGQLAAEYLLGRGCQHPACLDLLAGSPADAVRARYFAFHAAAAGHGGPCYRSPQPIPAADDPEAWEKLVAGAEAAVDEAVAARPRPDGLFVTSTLLLGPVYRRLRRHGVEPGGGGRGGPVGPGGPGVAVVSSGHHEPVLAALDPRPASIDLRGEVIGRAAVQQLLHRIRKPGDDLPVDLLIRATLVEPEEQRSQP